MLLVGGWVNRHQLDVIAYLQEENRLLKKRLQGRRLRFTDHERRRLARKARALGYRVLGRLNTLVTPDTLLRWYRELVVRKWTFARRNGPGRPRTQRDIEELILRMATENPSWGYTRIRGALTNLGHEIGRGTIATILKENGIDPANKRQSTTQWSTFLKAHWESLVATDFFSVEVFTTLELATHYVLFFIDIATRRVHIAGATQNPDEAWMLQIARNLTDPIDGFIRSEKYIIMDRDTKYCWSFRSLLESEGNKVIQLPARSPNLNAFAERFVRSIKEECLDRMIFVSHRQLEYALSEYMSHYHAERNHQGLHNRLLTACEQATTAPDSVRRRRRLGGLLSFYLRKSS